VSRTLGVVLAGGQSRRFGSDKALALLDGRPLIDHALAALAGCDALVVAGRDWPGMTSLPDRPAPDLGPLGGLCAALHHAAANGFTRVASLPVDSPALPADWRAQLGDGPVHALGQPVIGIWPASLADGLEAYLADGGRRVRDWVAAIEAPTVDLGPLANVNNCGDLAAFTSVLRG
jgi:molybdenum cofactor guanylyltransferase